MKKELVVLAAGMGSRYGGLKQIDPVGPSGERVIDYSIYDARRAGFDRVIFVIRREMLEAFREGIGNTLERTMDVAYAFQQLDDLPPPYAPPAGREKPWGTGHALYAARKEISNPFAVINADDFYGPAAFTMLARHLDQQGDSQPPLHVMVAYELARTVSEHGSVSRGLCRVTPENLLIDIEEVTAIVKRDSGLVSEVPGSAPQPHDPRTPTSMNCWGFFPSVMPELEQGLTAFLAGHGTELKAEFYLPGIISSLIAARKARVKIIITPEAWFGVTYREDKPHVMAGIQALVAAGTYPASLWPD